MPDILLRYFLWISLIALPALRPAPPPEPGTEQVQLTEVKGLEKVIRLSELDPRDEAQRLRLKELSERAKKLREKLRTGALEDSVIEIEVQDGGQFPTFRIWTGQGMEEMNGVHDDLPVYKGTFGRDKDVGAYVNSFR